MLILVGVLSKSRLLLLLNALDNHRWFLLWGLFIEVAFLGIIMVEALLNTAFIVVLLQYR